MERKSTMVWSRTGGVLTLKKFYMLIFIILMIPIVCMAKGTSEEDYVVMNDMYVHPGNYIRYGGMSIGFSFLINKNSIDVQQYNPPNYIIAAREVTYHYDSFAESHNGIGESASTQIIRYSYDLKNRKMYKEVKDEKGSLFWKYLDPSQSKSYHDDNPIAAGELLCYLAYNMSFYDKPVTYSAREYINNGRSDLPLAKLPNDGDNTIHHIYNHRTNQIEWWKPEWNKNKKTTEFIRVK